MNTRLPSMTLTAGETPLLAEQFIVSIPAFFLHVKLGLTDRRLYATHPNRAFVVIPVGSQHWSVPIDSIASVAASTRLSPTKTVAGILSLALAVLALSVPHGGIYVFLFALIGVALLLTSTSQVIEVRNTGGGTFSVRVSVLERQKTILFVSDVSGAIASMDRPPQPQPSNPPADPAASLSTLEDLRVRGLLTPAEYSEKRSEILRRL